MTQARKEDRIMKVFFCICKAPPFDEEDAIMDADDMIGDPHRSSWGYERAVESSDSAREGFPFAAAGTACARHPARHSRHRSPAKSRIGRASEARSEEVEEEP